METFTCYRIFSEFRNAPSTIQLTPPTDGTTYEAVQCALPKGYTMQYREHEVPLLCDDNGVACFLCPGATNQNNIVAVNQKKVKYLHVLPTDKERMPLQFFRQQTEMTPQHLADAAGVNVSQIRKLESGEISIENVSAKNLLAIADALNIDPHKLL